MVWRNEGTLSVQQRRKSCDPPCPRLPCQKAHAVIVDLDSDEEEEDVIVKTEVKQEIKKEVKAEPDEEAKPVEGLAWFKKKNQTGESRSR